MSIFILLFNQDEVVQPFFPPVHEDEEAMSLNDIDDSVEDPSDVVDHHINDFIYIGRHRWDVRFFVFDGDPIYDMEGGFQIKNVDVLPSKKWFSCLDALIIQRFEDDMVIENFHPLRDG